MAAETADFVVEEVVGVDAPPELFTRGPGDYLTAEQVKAGVERTPWACEVTDMLVRLFPPEAVAEVARWVREARNCPAPQIRLKVTCPVKECKHPVGKDKFLCKPHWNTVPRTLQRKVRQARGAQQAVYISAVLDAIAAATRAASRRQAS